MPHPDSLLPPSDLANGYADLLATLASTQPDVLAHAADTMEADAARHGIASPGAFLARAWIARVDSSSAHGLQVEQARATAGTYLAGDVADLLRRDAQGLVFRYRPATEVHGQQPPLVRVRPDGHGYAVVEFIDPTDGSANPVATPGLVPPEYLH